ncbi:hypothetical protein JOQ06_009473 [Pogonophryne albipinna]|uniref:Link domain-containing protein n=1 Tax=Pogonophryne albipinna TaxID=1090488 RepID=A0AAD6BP44_9TELE|nr:hypothetical protein JOQ06_009473 [Pogonophryne albipinna]
MIWLCFTLVLSFTSVISDQNIDSSHIRGKDQSVAGVFQVSDLNYLNQPQYSYNASDARSLCLSLGVNIASKAQLQEALTRGLETCRYGWIDEHLAVVPRVKALPNCGQNKTGLVTWRVDVTKKRRSRAVSTDIKQAEEYIQTVEWTSEEKTEKTEEAAQEDERMEDERIEVEENAS